MKIKYRYPFLIYLLISFCTCAQTKVTHVESKDSSTLKTDSNFIYSHFIAGNFLYMDVDVLNNIYLITNNNQLKKYKPNGDSTGVFNDVKKFGNPSLIDVSNPLKVLLYYKSFSTVVVLDRFLTFRNNINFRDKNIFKVNALATSYDNNIWIFDEQDFKLKKINDDGTVLSQTNDWRQIFDQTPTPIEIQDRDGYVYLYDPQKGFYIFDYYGSLKNNLPFLAWEHIAVANNTIMGFVKNTLMSYELSSLNIKKYNLPNFINNYTNIKAVNGYLYLLKKEGVEIYKIK